MTIKQLAEYYLKYWYLDSASKYTVSDNAPATLWKFVFGLPKHTDRTMVFSALMSLVTGRAPSEPSMEDILKWFATHPHAVSHCDDILKGKAKVTSFDKLIAKAYSAEMSSIVDKVHKFLTSIPAIY